MSIAMKLQIFMPVASYVPFSEVLNINQFSPHESTPRKLRAKWINRENLSSEWCWAYSMFYGKRKDEHKMIK